MHTPRQIARRCATVELIGALCKMLSQSVAANAANLVVNTYKTLSWLAVHEGTHRMMCLG